MPDTAQILVEFTAPVSGSLIWTPSSRHLGVGDEAKMIYLPTSITTKLTSNPITFEIPLTGPGWCWRINEMFVGGGQPRWVLVTQDAAYSDLVEVNPADYPSRNVLPG